MSWIKPQAERLELPSGNTAECKKPDIMSLVMHNAGNIPDFLTGQLTSRLTGKGKPVTNESGDIKADDWPKLAIFIDLVVSAAMVNPQIVTDNPDYDADIARILIDDVASDDKLFIFSWAMPSEELAATESFRNGSADGGHLSDASDSRKLRRKAVKDVRTQQPLDSLDV